MEDSQRIVFVGHSNNGKSTLLGSLLTQLNIFTDDQVRQAERDAAANKMESWKWAYLLDESEHERQSGITVEYLEVPFTYENKSYVMVDTPGHNQLIKYMIEGCENVDIGIFLVSCRKGEFEKSLQDIDHLAVLKCLGISHLIVVLNKYDVLPKDADLDKMKLQVVSLLKKFGLKKYSFVIASAYLGMNLTQPQEGYPSQTLLETLQTIPRVPKKIVEPWSSQTITLKGLVVGQKMLVVGYQAVLHGGKVTKEIEIVSIRPKPFARPNEECVMVLELKEKTEFRTHRFILRDGDQTLFLGVTTI
jgi:translation elongation factor EF-1alpha